MATDPKNEIERLVCAHLKATRVAFVTDGMPIWSEALPALVELRPDASGTVSINCAIFAQVLAAARRGDPKPHYVYGDPQGPFLCDEDVRLLQHYFMGEVRELLIEDPEVYNALGACTQWLVHVSGSEEDGSAQYAGLASSGIRVHTVDEWIGLLETELGEFMTTAPPPTAPEPVEHVTFVHTRGHWALARYTVDDRKTHYQRMVLSALRNANLHLMQRK